ncbi:MAG: protein phosphatase 2C domain-containing protein [Desulfovibrio sp.]|jgi:protein phosphatase|nr:protein phosphatase 2C domain-containing protein [Desulfovibrio sp. OttesenSCG-928-G15]MDR2574729.1 protein phosphatase 2C domain-containing protein [Desulfovibrio sp.]
MSLQFKAQTHTGNKRQSNEDRYFVREQADGSLLMAVADGVGGMPGGEKAAELAMEAIAAAGLEERLSPERLYQLATSAHDSIVRYAAAHPRLEGMGTTLTAAVVRENAVFWVHVGDSRLYIQHSATLRQLTTDHRFLSSMIEDGDITAEEALNHPLRNMLDQCLGCPSIEPEQGNVVLEPGDRLLLCTDGLYGEVPHERVKNILLADMTAKQKATQLLEASLNAGGKDNITLVVVDSPAHNP